MTQSQSFSNGMELATFVTSSGVLCRTWDVIDSRYQGITSCVGNGMFWKVYEEPGSGLTVVAFEVKEDFNLESNRVSSSDLRKKGCLQFEFLCTKKIPDFSVNASVVSLFYENLQGLDQLKSQINSKSQVIVTGHALGGTIAAIFTLSLLDSIGSGKKRLLCITFGSPLIGDENLLAAVSRNSTWNSCFLHMVSCKDPLPKKLRPCTSDYMPFGTFLFCSDNNSTCFENPDSILEVLLSSMHDQSQGLRRIDYGNIVEGLYRKAICKDFTAQLQDLPRSNSLQACISVQLLALGLIQHMQQQLQINDLVTKIVAQERKFNFQKGGKFDPSKKLNVMKIDMAQLEWYKKDSKNRHIGYYDSYKKMYLTSDQDAVKFQKNLTNYWNDMVEEVEMKPQTEGAAFRTRWLYGGTNYRRMVEPLDIAEYYGKGGKDYVKNGRSRHYKVLEEWVNEARTPPSDPNSISKKNVELILTIDSCFWAHVEEALLSCQQLEFALSSLAEKDEATRKLLQFEEYVYESLKKYEVSPEIFLKDSSYMAWWNRYKTIRGTTGIPALASFMSNPNNFDQYTEGTYDFR
ncbi:senescence-associated carboxylesterase 101 isoform X2 [Abrus precatorius]|uniref:Senescence-associated carboxylesterase 101 isoform X2 n=1 Tax=Abrus precatorius TaxID=3816 RepID=A0A8B8LP14_ABRPR|nr:senescence-associated carboxylesterase 101 isoform X2 [Abrus precatorius]